MVQINDSLFADETEISNLSYKEFEKWTALKYGKLSEEHLSALPDTNVWLSKNNHNASFSCYYYQHLSYNDYPVVGISYEQAKKFCVWRAEQIKYYLSIRKKFDFPEFIIRLPSEKEWEMITNSGFLYKQNEKKQGKTAKKGNFLLDTNSGIVNNQYTEPVYSYYPNFLGIYNLMGNVAEMVLEKGISKGGSWQHTEEESLPGKKIYYKQPESWLGFRCVCIVKRK